MVLAVLFMFSFANTVLVFVNWKNTCRPSTCYAVKQWSETDRPL